MDNLYNTIYNPDVLSCLANLSNDEVFTPPEVANEMLDLLPQELFENPDVKFLDPACKSGVFLREIAKRLLEGLEPIYPDLQERADHIFKEQLYGIAITELTANLSRRSVYCSKFANGKYSVCDFDTVDGNIRYKKIQHKWKDGKCVYCGAPQSQYDRSDDLETYAYEFIHTINPEDIFGMKFDVIIGNPPYHLNTSNENKQAKPLYPMFVEQAKKLKPRYLSMIIPSRWFAGGLGLDSFRDTMMHDKHITHMVDYANAKDCFPQNSIGGGVSYFLWERDQVSDCEFTSINGDNRTTVTRALDEFPVLVRYNDSVSIIHKIKSLNETSLDTIASPLMPFGFSTNVRGTKKRKTSTDLILHASDGQTYIDRSLVKKGEEYIDKYKVLISKTGAEHAGEPNKDGKFKVLTSSLRVIGPGEICTHSYFIIGACNTQKEAENILTYLKTKFVRFLILLSMSSINLSKQVLSFVPLQDFSKPWMDEELYAKYNLTNEEIGLIDSMIKSMNAGGAE